VDLWSRRELVESIQEDGKELSSQRSYNCARKYALFNYPGANQSLRPEEKKPSQANLFEEEDGELPTYHEKQKLYEKLRHLEER